MQIGDIIKLGKYSWRVLCVESNKALLITEEIIEQRCYHNADKEVTWEQCSLRKYLNDDFFVQFPSAEQERILLVENANENNQWYGTKGGANTQDKIFLLSLHQACLYFGDSTANLYNPGKNQRYWFERKDANNQNRLAKLLGKEGCWWWWLRSPGRVGKKAVYIWGTDGGIGIQGNNVKNGNVSDGKCTDGVRPALWLRL